MKEPRLEPRAEEPTDYCPSCGQDSLENSSLSWTDSMEDWLDKAFENKMKAQGCL
jgi:hypothetical protein